MIFLMENLADHLSKNKHSRKDALELYITIKGKGSESNFFDKSK